MAVWISHDSYITTNLASSSELISRLSFSNYFSFSVEKSVDENHHSLYPVIQHSKFHCKPKAFKSSRVHFLTQQHLSSVIFSTQLCFDKTEQAKFNFSTLERQIFAALRPPPPALVSHNYTRQSAAPFIQQFSQSIAVPKMSAWSVKLNLECFMLRSNSKTTSKKQKKRKIKKR